MSDEPQVGCARPTGGPVGGPPPEDVDDTQPVHKEPSPMIHVGKPAPDFEAPSYQQGRFGSEKHTTTQLPSSTVNSRNWAWTSSP